MKASIRDVFIYKIFAKQNPILTPTLRARTIFEAAHKIRAISTVASYAFWAFNDKMRPDGNVVRWAAHFMLDQCSEMVLPPDFTDRLALPGTLRRWAMDAGGYGGYLLRVFAELVIDCHEGDIPNMEKPVYFRLAFPNLYAVATTNFTDSNRRVAAVEATVASGELIILKPDWMFENEVAQLANIEFDKIAQHIPEEHQNEARVWHDKAKNGDIAYIAGKIRGCSTAQNIFQELKEKFLD